MTEEVAETILREYRKSKALFENCANNIADLLEVLLREADLNIHSINCRVKAEENLREKIGRTDAKYESLQDVTDIVGIRVITYFEDDVYAAAKVIENEFEIDRNNSVDKKALLDPDRFGYLSLHYVVKLSMPRREMSEYRRYKEVVMEIQIRSILQHAWAEIEHDLGYKSKEAVPAAARRRFSGLAGLLELADGEFIRIRDELKAYRDVVRDQITEAPATVPIDQATLTEFVTTNAYVLKLDTEIVNVVGAQIVRDEAAIGRMVRNLIHVGISSIGEIEDQMRKFGDAPLKLARSLIEGKKYKTLYRGICLWYLCYLIVAKEGNVNAVKTYLDFAVGSKGNDKFASTLIKAFKDLNAG